MVQYLGSGPYCYANSLAMVLGTGPQPWQIEVLTGSPFGVQLIGGRLPFFDPYGWDPVRGLDDAIELLGYRCARIAAPEGRAALAMLRDAVAAGPVLAGPVEIGLLRHQPGMAGPIGSDHFVTVLEVDGDLVRFHDPQGYPYATLPVTDFLAAWRAETVPYPTTPYLLRTSFEQVRQVTVDDALRACLPAAAAWLRGRTDLPVPPGTLAGAAAVHRLADQVAEGLDPDVRAHLVHFAIRVGARRLADAATALGCLGLDEAARTATVQARLVGSLQHDLVTGAATRAAATLRDLAPTYEDLAAALRRPGAGGSPG